MENHPTDILANYKVKAIETMCYWQRGLRKKKRKKNRSERNSRNRAMHICEQDIMKMSYI